MKIQQIPLEKQITYMIDITTNIPVIVYVNDIKASELNMPLGTAIDLNPYVLKNGKCKIKLQIFPLFRRGDTLVTVENIMRCNLFFGSYIRNKETNEILNYKADVALPIVAPKEDVPYFEQEWEVELTELPYELEGWSKGQDLRKWDKKELEKKVVAYYQKLWSILNNGEGERYMDLWKQADQELMFYDYETDYDSIYKEESEEIKKNCTDNMIPLEDYELKLYAEGKLVTLERKTHTREFNNYSPLDIKGWSPLIRKGRKSGAEDFPVKLYLPQGSNEFVIIRK
ncbi:hypothetical protein [Capnocytophaga sp. oral taxon 878]|uniref:hypothetical protein n=1 Tax=Capnocytophaga sp. oral taxon 878 TaxID=1316596 RepID=UPI000D034E0B|nr:hypothetical protein [Capnocytophaga sp. oral taxon 878]AVM50634.1 hypothetical protein C4H12_09210 [Capnocytophaga sp. oral taxon 878]